MPGEFKLDTWLAGILAELRSAFGERLLFAAHAGSWVRGEAGPSSDIDINVVLDEVRAGDITAYRRIVDGLPFREKACGFICGSEEMRAWPRHELFHFMNGCKVLHGSLDGIVEAPSRREVAEYLRINASGILHYARHTLIYDRNLKASAEALGGVYKSVFFILQAKLFLETGIYVPTKKEVVRHLADKTDKEMFSTALEWAALPEGKRRSPEHYFEQLAVWSGGLLLFAERQSRA